MRERLKEILSAGIIDMRLRTDYKHYILQSLLIFVCVALILLLYEIFGGVIAASLGASSFILFVTPHKNGSRSRYVVGGYICGAVSGVLFSLLYHGLFGVNPGGAEYALIIFRAAAVSVAVFMMIILNLEHPPAAALALGLTVEPECIKTAAAAAAGVIILCIIRRLIKKHLIDLI